MGLNLVEELRKRVPKHAGLEPHVALYAGLFALQSSTEEMIPPPPIGPTEVQSRLSRRVPGMAPEDFRPDEGLLRATWEQVWKITHQHRPDLQEPLEHIRDWMENGKGKLPELALYYLRGELEWIGPDADVDISLLQFLINQTLRPFLHRYAEAIAPWIDQEKWYQPYCPVCGGLPDFAVLRKPYGARWLLCSRCDFEWPYRRVSCPYCGCEDPEKYQYVPSEDQVYRLYLCDRCHHYLKTLDQREIMEERPLPVERVVTLPMDVAAHQAGYKGI